MLYWIVFLLLFCLCFYVTYIIINYFSFWLNFYKREHPPYRVIVYDTRVYPLHQSDMFYIVTMLTIICKMFSLCLVQINKLNSIQFQLAQLNSIQWFLPSSAGHDKVVEIFPIYTISVFLCLFFFARKRTPLRRTSTCVRWTLRQTSTPIP